MSPELRTRSSLSPLATRGAWLTGGAVASLALVFGGLATPASAFATGTPSADVVAADPKTGDECDNGHGHHDSKYKPEGKAQTPGGPRHDKCEDRENGRDHDRDECSDIDSVVSGRYEEISAVLTGGKAYAGERDSTSSSLGEYEWEEISDEDYFPKNACAISISTNGDRAWIKVLTTKGSVWETRADKEDGDFSWDDRWRKLTTPDDDDYDVTNTREKGEQVAPVQPRS